jgi:hypothetical protein
MTRHGTLSTTEVERGLKPLHHFKNDNKAYQFNFYTRLPSAATPNAIGI